MAKDSRLRVAQERLRTILNSIDNDSELKKRIPHRDDVIKRFQHVFQQPEITEEQFKEFLPFSNNRHWSGLPRLGPRICQDMQKLRRALGILLDENQLIAERLNRLIPPHGKPLIPYFGRAVITPILIVTYPEKYGVWNNVSEDALKELHIWPKMASSKPFGEKYLTINNLLLNLCAELKTDLWTLDWLLWRITEPNDGNDGPHPPGDQHFGLERHLHEFLRDNWDVLPLAKEWAIHEEDGEPEAGYEYGCEVGKIDLLARHRTENRWLVIELKKDQTGDTTIGQVLRYMGWVRKNLADSDNDVEGLIIAKDFNNKIRYALLATQDVSLQRYKVEFELLPPVDLNS